MRFVVSSIPCHKPHTIKLVPAPCHTPLTNIVTIDAQQRVISASIAGLRVICVYVPNGQSVDSDKYAYKLDWCRAVALHLRNAIARHPSLAMAGDFNVAPEDRDIYDPAAWAGQVLCSPPERAACGPAQAASQQPLSRD